MDRNEMNGRVCLVGAGCDCADLITVRGQKQLLNADVIVYDDLLDEDLLEQLPSTTETIYVGKRNGAHSAVQEEINQLLITLAKQGKQVCRLKGGDSFVFGRGGEEIDALNKAGIPWEIVPGISSSVAIPELAGIPVTHRGVSRSFHVVTAHSAKTDEQLSQRLVPLANLEGTLIFLMGLSRLDKLCEGLIGAGKPADTPVTVIGDSIARGTLADITEKAQPVNPPAVILVGGTAGMNLNPTSPLSGVTIGLTGTSAFRQSIQPALKHMGATVRCLQRSTLQTMCPPETLQQKLNWLRASEHSWIAFTSPKGVDQFFEQLAYLRWDIRQLAPIRFAAISPGTAAQLEQHGIYADLVPQEHTSDALCQCLAEHCVPDSRILLLHGNYDYSAAIDTLRKASLSVQDILLYALVGGKADARQTDYVVFPSAGAVKDFFSNGGTAPRKAALCIGKPTQQAAAQWCNCTLLVKSASPKDLLNTIVSDAKETIFHE